MSRNLDFKKDLARLVESAKQNETRAQAAIIELTQAKLFKFCVLLGHNRELAEDLCQEAYIKAFNNLHKLNDPESFYSWLCQVAKNLFYDIKRSQKEDLMQSEDADVEDEHESTDPQMESIIQVQRVLKEFEPDDRFILLMIELEGMSYKETADLMKTSEDAIRSKLHRLRQVFIKKIKN